MELDASFNARHSNSEGLPEIDRDSQKELVKISAKEKEHYNFLNSLRKNFNVDCSKLIDLECRISGKIKLVSNLEYRDRKGNDKLKPGIKWKF